MLMKSQQEMFAPVGRTLAALEERLDKVERGDKEAEPELPPEDRAYVPHYDGETLSPVWKDAKSTVRRALGRARWTRTS